MKLFAIGLVGLLAGCSQSNPDVPTPEPDTANCPEQVSPAYIDVEAQNLYDVYKALNFQIHDIKAKADTITFQSRDRTFIYCRSDGSWTIQPGKYVEEEYQYFAEPPYQTIQLNEQSYQYRVLFDPIPTPDSTKEPQQVVFELILPQQKQPIRQVLYTLEQAKQLETAVSLGVPQVSAAVTYGHRLFWAVSPEQGEGNGGVATIVSYNPQTEAIAVIQPAEINAQQINDLAIAGEPDHPTFWIATQRMGEGNPYLPSMGLVAYRPDTSDYQTGSIELYHVRNSPIVGAIPTELEVEGDALWVGTGNGICQVQWQAADNLRSWNCWRLALMSALPEEVPLYTSLLAETPQTNLAGDTAEVLWWSPQSYAEGSTGRYEVYYSEGFTVTLEEQGASLSIEPDPWEPPVYWAGWQWHWRGDRFKRGLDEVSLSAFGGGPTGISLPRPNNRPPVPLDHHSMRGDLELVKLTQDTTQVKYYSGWVENGLLKPYLTLVPQEKFDSEPNPLDEIANKL